MERKDEAKKLVLNYIALFKIYIELGIPSSIEFIEKKLIIAIKEYLDELKK